MGTNRTTVLTAAALAFVLLVTMVSFASPPRIETLAAQQATTTAPALTPQAYLPASVLCGGRSEPLVVYEPEELLFYDWQLSGAVNGAPVAASGRLVASTADGAIDAKLHFTEIPSTFTPYASGFSLLSISCVNGGGGVFIDQPPPMNLVSLTGGNYSGRRTFTIRDSGGLVVGELAITLEMTRKSRSRLAANVTISGNYSGPIDIVDMTGYDLPLRQSGRGRLVGQYTQVITTTNSTPYTITADAEYSYNNDKTEPPGTVLQVVYHDFSFDGHDLTLTGAAHVVGPLAAANGSNCRSVCLFYDGDTLVNAKYVAGTSDNNSRQLCHAMGGETLKTKGCED